MEIHNEKKNLTIGVDVDGTLTDLNGFYNTKVAKMLKKEPVLPEAYSFGEIFGLSKSKELLYGSKVLEKYCKECPLRDGAKTTLSNLKNKGHNLHLITARKFVTSSNLLGYRYRKLLHKWLEKNGLTFDSKQYCSEKDSPRDKLLGCRKLHVDIMIEDKSDVALYLAENGVRVILIDNPYNKDVSHDNIIRVNSWDEVETKIDELSENLVKPGEFLHATSQEIEKMSDEEKIRYYNQYYAHLKSGSLKLNTKELNKGKKAYRLMYTLMYPVMKLKFKPIIENKDNVPYQDGKLFCSNHVKSSDNYLIDLGLGKHQYYAGFAASEIQDSFRGRIFKLTRGAVFIDRKDPNSRKETSEQLATRLVYGDNVLIFPEGTRKNKTEEGRKKTILPFHKGAVAMAQKTGTAIIPMAIYYGKKNRIRFAEPFYVSPLDDVEVSTMKLQNLIEGMVIELKEKDEAQKQKQKQKKLSKGCH